MTGRKIDYSAVAEDARERLAVAFASDDPERVREVIDELDRERDARMAVSEAAFRRKQDLMMHLGPIALALISAVVALVSAWLIAPLAVDALAAIGVEPNSVAGLIVGAAVTMVAFWGTMFSPFAIDRIRQEITWRKDRKYLASDEYKEHLRRKADIMCRFQRNLGAIEDGQGVREQ